MENPVSQFPEGWYIVEMFGHIRMGGYVREVQIAGGGSLRIDVPGEGDEIIATSFFTMASVFRLTAVSEAVARQEARLARPAPVKALEAPRGDDDYDDRLREHDGDYGREHDDEDDSDDDWR